MMLVLLQLVFHLFLILIFLSFIENAYLLILGRKTFLTNPACIAHIYNKITKKEGKLQVKVKIIVEKNFNCELKYFLE